MTISAQQLADRYAAEQKLALSAPLTVPTITLDGMADGVVPATDGRASAAKFRRQRSHRQIPAQAPTSRRKHPGRSMTPLRNWYVTVNGVPDHSHTLHPLHQEIIMTQLDKVVYTGKTRTSSGGRNGTSRSSDGRLDIQLSSPDSARAGTNPEQLFAAGWSACFIGAIGIAAAERKIALPSDMVVDAEVDLGTISDAYFLQARLNVSLPGIEREIAQALVDFAHQNCPYSKATRGNINVEINLV